MQKKGVASVEGIEALNAVSTSMAAKIKTNRTMSTGNPRCKKTKQPKKTGDKCKKMQEVVCKDTSQPIQMNYKTNNLWHVLCQHACMVAATLDYARCSR
jgi:hypothetical protein